MKAMVERITGHNENEVVTNPEYCSFFQIKFYGKELPKEMTLSKNGFIMRRRYQLEFVDLFPEIIAVFGYTKNGVHEIDEGYGGKKTMIAPDDA